MPQRNKKAQPPAAASRQTVRNIDLGEEELRKLIDSQTQSVKNEAARIAVHEKSINAQLDIARQTIASQTELEKLRPSEERKTSAQRAWFGLGFTVVIAAFVFGLLYIGEKESLFKILDWLGYLFTAAIGYLIGERKGRGQTPEVEDAEVVE